MAEVRLEIDIAHPPERVWRALTDARLLGEWFMPTDLEPSEGAWFTLEPGTLPGFLGPVSGELTELAQPHRLTMLWQGEKLYTRVSWELTPTGEGCQLQVVQSGFIGAPAALRRRALRDTYNRLFGEQLPALLDRLAAGAVAGDGAPAAPAGVPRQRARGNVAVAAWSAGRTLRPPAGGAEPAPMAAPPAVGVPAPRPPVEAVSPAPSGAMPSTPPAAAEGPERRGAAREGWRWRLAVVPGWVRALAIGGSAAVLVVAALAVVSHTPPLPELNAGGAQGTGPRGDPDGPGVAWQPGAETSQTESTGAAGAAPGAQPGSPETAGSPGSAPENASSAGPGEPVTTPGSPGSPEGTPTAGPTPATPELTARMGTSGLPLLGGRAVTVTVSNSGPGSAVGWEVAMNVGDQQVTDVTGASHERDGDQVTFTPLDAELAGGASTEFSFDVPAPVLGLLGASDPTGCTIDGRPCD